MELFVFSQYCEGYRLASTICMKCKLSLRYYTSLLRNNFYVQQQFFWRFHGML